MTKSFDIILTQPARASYSNIFRCFEDVELMKQWVDGLVDFHIIQSSDINQTERRFHQISKFCGRKVEYKGKVESWNPPSQITLFVEDLNFTFEMYFQILSDNDRTRIEFKGNLQCHQMWVRLFKRPIIFFTKILLANELKKLSRVSEKISDTSLQEIAKNT